MKLELEPVRVRLNEPFTSAEAVRTERELLLLTLEGGDGLVGTGEAAPLESYDGVSLEMVRAAIEDCRELLAEADGREHAELLRRCRERAILPQALAAIDLALWDLAGRRAGEPVWRLLGPATPVAVQVNATIAAPDRAGAASQAAAARGAGFGCVKLKVGLGDDAGRVAAVRAASGPGVAIRLDANGAWSVAEAAAALRTLEPAGIECCEEPVHGLAALRAVASATTVPIAADESAALPGAFDQRWCSLACLKLARCGGISGLIATASRARAAGYGVYLASTLDGPLGIAAALHAAAVIRPELPCGLATLGLFGDRPDPLPASAGTMSVPAGAGLGAGLADWYRAR